MATQQDSQAAHQHQEQHHEEHNKIHGVEEHQQNDHHQEQEAHHAEPEHHEEGNGQYEINIHKEDEQFDHQNRDVDAQSQFEGQQNEYEDRPVSNEMEEPQDEEEEYISVLNFNPDNLREPILNSPRSLMACQITGITPAMLVKKKPEEIYKMLQYKSNLNEEGLKILAENFEKRRLEKVKQVTQARENIMNDNLTRDDRKILQESVMLKNNSLMLSQYKSESNLDTQQKSIYHPTEHQSQVSQNVNARIEKMKYLQRREIENMIGTEIRTHRLIEEQDKKDQRLKLIAQQKEVVRQQRRGQFEENQQLKKQNLEKLKIEDAKMRLRKEQEYKTRQESSNQNLTALKNVIHKIRQEESNKKMIKSQTAMNTIMLKDEEKRKKVESKYLEKEQKFQKNQDLFRQYISRQGEKRDDKTIKAIDTYNRLNQERYDRLEKKRQEQEHKQQLHEERQRIIDRIRQREQINKINEYLHKDSRIKSANHLRAQTFNYKNSELMDRLEGDEQRQHERDILREKIISEKMYEKRMKEEETLRKKHLIVANELERKQQKYLMKEKAVTSKSQQLQTQKKIFFQNQSNLKLMKSIMAQENQKIILNQQEQKRSMINERLHQYEERRKQRDQDVKDAANQKAVIIRQTEVAKQALKTDLNRMFQSGKEINIDKISQKYNIQLDSEEQIMSRSMVDFDKPTRELYSSHSPSRNLHTSQQGQRTRPAHHERNDSDLKDHHQQETEQE